MKKGFTLIELLVVVAIIGVLSTIILSSLSTARAKARDTKMLGEVKSLQKALELYHLDHGEYPQGYPSSGGVYAGNCSDASPADLSQWENFISDLDGYLPKIPASRPWPNCIYYMSGRYDQCDAFPSPEYTIIFATEASSFKNFDLYNTQGENGSHARYCVYPL